MPQKPYFREQIRSPYFASQIRGKYGKSVAVNTSVVLIYQDKSHCVRYIYLVDTIFAEENRI